MLFLTGIEELNESEKSVIIKKSKLAPNIKFNIIKEGMTYLNQKNKKQIKIKGKFVELPSPDEVRQEWGISFGERFVEVIARTLNMPK